MRGGAGTTAWHGADLASGERNRGDDDKDESDLIGWVTSGR